MSASLMTPSAGNAPPISAGQTPDARPITLSEALNVALQHLQQDQLDGQTMMLLKSFYVASHQIIQMKAQAAMGGGQPGGPGGPPNAQPQAQQSNETGDYGSGFGDDTGQATAPYGSQ